MTTGGKARPAEVAALDPWAEISVLDARRSTMEAEARIKAAEWAAERKHDRRVMVWKGLGYTLFGAGVCGVLGGIIYALWSEDHNDERHKLEIEQERTEQVAHCTSLNEPIERQYCLLSLNLEPSDNNDED